MNKTSVTKRPPGRVRTILALGGFLCLLGFGLAGAAIPFPPGQALDRIECLQTPGETYALYLPTAYDPGRTWPVLFAFDPGGQVTVPLELFRPAAEKYGVILICPAGVKNGPLEPVFKAMQSVWDDACARLAIDRGRVYTAGFSGGARMATFFHLVIERPVVGIIACGAGLASSVRADQVKGIPFFGVAGIADFNYAEMVTLEGTLAGMGTPYRFLYGEGGHRWPPAETCLRAVEWLTVTSWAAKREPGAAGEPPLDACLAKETALAEERARCGEEYYAAADLEGIARTFAGLRPVDEVKRRAQALRSGEGYRSFQAEEGRRLREEAVLTQKAMAGFAYLARSEPKDVNLARLIEAMNLPWLGQRVKKGKTRYDEAMAARVLFAAAMKCAEDVEYYLGREDFARAGLVLEVGLAAAEGTPFAPRFHYRRGALQARLGERKKALKSLNRAVDLGLADLNTLEKDPWLDSLRGDPAFGQLLERLSSAQAAPGSANREAAATPRLAGEEALSLTPREWEVVTELNRARTDPRGYAEYLRELKRSFRDQYSYIGRGVTMGTKEGIPAVDEAISFLLAVPPAPELKASRALSLAAKDHLRDQTLRGGFGHRGSDGSNPLDRMVRYGEVGAAVGECIDYGHQEARDIVVALIVDDGVPDRGHRRAIFDPAFTLVGVGHGANVLYDWACVIDFAAALRKEVPGATRVL